MLGLPRMSALKADSMVQALLIPAPRFLQLVAGSPAVRTRAWQATAAQLAAQHNEILGDHKQLAPLNMFFRCARFWAAPPAVAAVVDLCLTGPCVA
jgi:hypothetical protein